MIFLGCCPPALPHIQKSRASEHFVCFRRISLVGGGGSLQSQGQLVDFWTGGGLRTWCGQQSGQLVDVFGGVSPPGRQNPKSSYEAHLDSWWLFLASWWIADLAIFHENFFGDAPADFLYGKRFMALYVKWLCPYKVPLAQGSNRHFCVCCGKFCPE
jgi:hypothetical protein